MIRHDVLQGSPQWLKLRLGLPTASCFGQIITPAKGELSKQSGKYMARLLAEKFLGYSLGSVSTKAMEMGREREPEAAALYEFEFGVQTEVVGFITTDDGKIGCSPDRFVGKVGSLEIKCPLPHTHIGYLIGGGSHYADYKPQVQGTLAIAELEWHDCLSYCHGFPRALWRAERDEPYIDKLRAALDQFNEQMAEAEQRLLKLGCKLPEPEMVQAFKDEFGSDWFDLTEDDAGAIYAGRRQ